MITEKFRGVVREEGLRDMCQCHCFPVGTAEQTSDHLGENDPTCKCTCWCSVHQANTQRNDDTSEASFEAETT